MLALASAGFYGCAEPASIDVVIFKCPVHPALAVRVAHYAKDQLHSESAADFRAQEGAGYIVQESAPGIGNHNHT